MQPTVAVSISPFEYPPTEKFVSTIQRMLPANFENCIARVETAPQVPEAHTADTIACLRYTMSAVEKLMGTNTDCTFAANVVPLQLEYALNDEPPDRQNLVFVAVRNKRGEEWLYAHFVGTVTAPLPVAQRLADAVNTVLEERGSLNPDVSQADVQRAIALISVITGGLEHVLYSNVRKKRATLQ